MGNDNESKSKLVALSVCLFVIFAFWIFTVIPPERLGNIASFISATGTLGILVLTAFYVVYTSRQITELRKQRQLQLQPLPNLRISEGAISRPFLVRNPNKATISPAVDIYLKCSLENVGNASAVLVDTIIEFGGNGINRPSEEYWARRFHVIKEKEKISYIEDLRENSPALLKTIHENLFGKGCPKNRFFSIIIHGKIFYRNILGTPFLMTIDHIVDIENKHKDVLSNWIGAMDSFQQEFAADIATFKAVFQRNLEESEGEYNKIREKFKPKFEVDSIGIKILPWAVSFNVKPLDEEEANHFEKNIHHSIPVNIGSERVILLNDSKTLKEHITDRLGKLF